MQTHDQAPQDFEEKFVNKCITVNKICVDYGYVHEVDKNIVDRDVFVDELILEIQRGLIVCLHQARSNFTFEGMSF